MNVQKIESLPPPPGIIGSLKAGFDAVSNHIGLILLPVALDILLWLGPRFSIGELANPFFKLVFDQARTTLTSSSDLKRFTDFQSGFSEVMQRFNLLSLLGKLQTFPIGVSSLLAQTMPVKTPLGSQSVVQVSSFPGLIGLMFLLVLLGWIAGGLYFRWVSGTTLSGAKQKMEVGFAWAILQTLILSVIWFIALMMILIPVM